MTEYVCDTCGHSERFRSRPSTSKEATRAGWGSWIYNGRTADLCPACNGRLFELVAGKKPTGPKRTSHDDANPPAPVKLEAVPA